MKTSDFFYELPEELIAQTPIEPRNSSKLMILNKETGEIQHRIFSDLTSCLNENDCLVLNDTRVIPARIYGIKEDTGAVVEFLLVAQKENDVWECLCKPGKRAKIGTTFSFGEGKLMGEVVDINEEDGNRFVRFSCDGNIFAVLDEIGSMPLPPYIKEKLQDKERYQTVYSRELGSAAAPTAGLHFTPDMLEEIKAKGVKIAYVTLHVGLGTFRPVKVDDVTKHHMHTEHYIMPQETADIINETKKNGGRVISVGTTSCRTLESVAAKNGCICRDEGDTSIFIYPGFEFKCIDALITNFHLPESTLIMLVSAFAGFDNVMNAYNTAVKEKYRFFSFGDSMFIC
ncbi:MAG: tRNA preQ1(34) S-adenosylmethionine ribosyltransferase-isomerase QueA [Eubacterium sp.]|nr:tRNA preQ1(34) S-adenosylmethionine ribosyltransferase-isomerase QueA [Eubacterium sp.]MDE6506390.1 tRNA preQ1(34) S-adenosylmethionine ribosyltransferase-isomerase QueA [Eubacterium sp.]